MPHSARTRKQRTASAIGVLVAVIGMTVGGGVAASAATATDTAKKCYIEVQVHGKWTKYEVPCG
ncbi:hypothetical protein [Streptomyces graminilatus]|uniref:hypothetical protein n=1 Tax=Streptomyces graminilatus TaxID=1464070 RepID=UPI0006E3B15A|nr:hypothetical protein [Streptomyces graminilatus]